MEQVQTRAFEALQPFVHLAKSSASQSPRFIANIITNATSSPNTFIFAELLETPAIQSLASPDTSDEYRSYLKLLEIFAWGTWEEYNSTPNLPALNDTQASKLRLLSLLTLATIHNPLTYPIVLKSLSLESHASLEALVTKAIYSSIISARLSPTTTPPVIHVASVAPLRDVRPQTVDTMISLLSEWQGRCGEVISGIEAEIAKITADAKEKRAREKDRTMRFQRSLDGWDGGDEGGSGGKNAGKSGRRSIFGSKWSSRFSKDGGGGGSSGSGSGSGSGGGGGRSGVPPLFGFGGSFTKGNKRDFNATGHHGGEYGQEDDGLIMDIDEGLGNDDISESARSAKRPLGIGTLS